MAMVQVNLLPKLKIDYLKSERNKRIVVLTSILAGIASISLFILLYVGVFVFQKNQIKNVDKKISSLANELKSVNDIEKILTIQNQLKLLPELTKSKPLISRINNVILKTTPSSANLSSITVDTVNKKLSISGISEDAFAVNKYSDTLKFTTITVVNKKTGDKEQKNLFIDVNTSVNRDASGASFTITTNYDESLFNSDNNIDLVVPSITSTRSSTETPGSAFGGPLTGTGQAQ
jgi:Tfp pilus assembly protein PilN